MNNIYSSPDEARKLLKDRFLDAELRAKVLEKLGDFLIPGFDQSIKAVPSRQLVSPDNGFLHFYFLSKYIGAEPHVLEFLDDNFVSFNEEKKGLGRIRFTSSDGHPGYVDVMNFKENEKKQIRDCCLHDGSSLVEFHHSLLAVEGLHVETRDNSSWFKSIGTAKDYYYYFYLHFVCFGAVVESFYDEADSAEGSFFREVVLPAISRIEEEVGVMPIIIRAYPDDQSEDEDFFWWDHSKNVNYYIEEYAHKENLVVKTFS